MVEEGRVSRYDDMFTWGGKEEREVGRKGKEKMKKREKKMNKTAVMTD